MHSHITSVKHVNSKIADSLHLKRCEEALEPLLTRLEKIRQGANDPEGRDFGRTSARRFSSMTLLLQFLHTFRALPSSPYYQQGRSSDF